MSISKQMMTFLVKNGFGKNDSEIIGAFVDSYNQHFNEDNIYDVTACGEYGLQGFVKEGQGLDMCDLGHMYEDYKKNPERNTYFFFNDDGYASRLVDHLDEYIDLMYENLSARDCFAMSIKFFEIMDTTNGHNKQLVEKINELWVKADKRLWGMILYAIAYRDDVECRDKGIIVACYQDALDNADLILQRVCDDGDLEMIINYFHYD